MGRIIGKPERMEHTQKSNYGIVYSCYNQRSRDGEHFVPEHALSYIVSGTMIFNDGISEHVREKGSFYLVRRNQLLKYTKIPPAHGEFKSLSIFLDQETLRKFGAEHNVTAKRHVVGTMIAIEKNTVLETFLHSLMQYHETQGFNNKAVIELKVKECLLLLLQFQPDLANVLFDFSEPGKIDLESFMNRNYHFNVGLERFAYLTGRSLATFKRDFEKLYHLSPHRWLLQKRLQEALFLIKEKGKSSSDIYLDLGFEDLSHFSYVFKKQFGVSPTEAGRTV
jgi:AraC-like DNA-binding protein